MEIATKEGIAYPLLAVYLCVIECQDFGRHDCAVMIITMQLTNLFGALGVRIFKDPNDSNNSETPCTSTSTIFDDASAVRLVCPNPLLQVHMAHSHAHMLLHAQLHTGTDKNAASLTT